MTYKRNSKRKIIKDDSDEYRKLLEDKGINFISHLSSLTFKSDEDKKDFPFKSHIWQANDRLYKLAQTYYGDPKLWWIIAHANQKPTDAHFSPGDEIKIPEANFLENVIKYLGY